MVTVDPAKAALNALCPYFTMFPLSFPLTVLAQRAQKGDEVLDPFCGRGTTNYAARLLGLGSVGVDVSPVATAITSSKLVSVRPQTIVAEACRILDSEPPAVAPGGAFWRLAFHPAVLDDLSRLRAALVRECVTPAQLALRGLLLGALHGPQARKVPTYFSNQCPRTYSPKPAYAVRYWKKHRLRAKRADVLALIAMRAQRYFRGRIAGSGEARLADSREAASLRPRPSRPRFRWIVTSPPYYGMRSYVQDQWLRLWFLGGPSEVDYGYGVQVDHGSPEVFSGSLRTVWRNASQMCSEDARLIIRFGGIAVRRIQPLELLKCSLRDSGWRIQTIRPAGTAREGKRQAETFLHESNVPLAEYDLWAEVA